MGEGRGEVEGEEEGEEVEEEEEEGVGDGIVGEGMRSGISMSVVSWGSREVKPEGEGILFVDVSAVGDSVALVVVAVS